MTENMSSLQRYFINKATEKARIRNITVNGKPATVTFSEYEAPATDIEEFRKHDGTDGHFYYITFYIWHGHTSYWTEKPISIAHHYLTNQVEGNKIYEQIKETNTYNI